MVNFYQYRPRYSAVYRGPVESFGYIFVDAILLGADNGSPILAIYCTANLGNKEHF